MACLIDKENVKSWVLLSPGFTVIYWVIYNTVILLFETIEEFIIDCCIHVHNYKHIHKRFHDFAHTDLYQCNINFILFFNIISFSH